MRAAFYFPALLGNGETGKSLKSYFSDKRYVLFFGKSYTVTMRIILFSFAVLLTGCSTSQPIANVSPRAGDASAQVHCLSKGYDRRTHDFEVCYNNRPEIQAGERKRRLSSMEIIDANRSPRANHARSYPVE